MRYCLLCRSGTRRLKTREVGIRVIAGARQRARGDEQEALRLGRALVAIELFGRDEALHLGVLARRLQVLADGEEIDVSGPEIIHELKHSFALLAEADHDAGLREDRRVQLLSALEDAQRMEVARAGADTRI